MILRACLLIPSSNSIALDSPSIKLYDNGTNGDIIPNNGIYNILTKSDTILLPNIEPKIVDIEMPNTFALHQTNIDTMNISINIYGKAFQLTSILNFEDNHFIKDSTIINLDNTFIKLEVNSDFMNKGVKNDDVLLIIK